jgi:hypothetical protein
MAWVVRAVMQVGVFVGRFPIDASVEFAIMVFGDSGI